MFCVIPLKCWMFSLSRNFQYTTVLVGIVIVLSVLFATLRVIKKSMKHERRMMGSSTTLSIGSNNNKNNKEKMKKKKMKMKNADVS